MAWCCSDTPRLATDEDDLSSQCRNLRLQWMRNQCLLTTHCECNHAPIDPQNQGWSMATFPWWRSCRKSSNRSWWFQWRLCQFWTSNLEQSISFQEQGKTAEPDCVSQSHCLRKNTLTTCLSNLHLLLRCYQPNHWMGLCGSPGFVDHASLVATKDNVFLLLCLCPIARSAQSSPGGWHSSTR